MKENDVELSEDFQDVSEELEDMLFKKMKSSINGNKEGFKYYRNNSTGMEIIFCYQARLVRFRRVLQEMKTHLTPLGWQQHKLISHLDGLDELYNYIPSCVLEQKKFGKRARKSAGETFASKFVVLYKKFGNFSFSISFHKKISNLFNKIKIEFFRNSPSPKKTPKLTRYDKSQFLSKIKSPKRLSCTKRLSFSKRIPTPTLTEKKTFIAKILKEPHPTPTLKEIETEKSNPVLIKSETETKPSDQAKQPQFSINTDDIHCFLPPQVEDTELFIHYDDNSETLIDGMDWQNALSQFGFQNHLTLEIC